MCDSEGYFSRTFQVLEFSRKHPGLSRRRGNPGQTTSKFRTSMQRYRDKF